MKKIVTVCTGKTCDSRFSKYILARLENDKKYFQYPENIIITPTTCMGNCENGPNIKIDNELFSWQNPVKASENLRKKIEEWKKIFA